MPSITIKTDDQKNKTINVLNQMIDLLKRKRQNAVDDIITPWIGEEVRVGWRKTKTLLTDAQVESHLRHNEWSQYVSLCYAKDDHMKEIISYNDAIGAIKASLKLGTPVELTGDVPGDIGWFLSKGEGYNS